MKKWLKTIELNIGEVHFAGLIAISYILSISRRSSIPNLGQYIVVSNPKPRY
jgi:hypothetical protein